MLRGHVVDLEARQAAHPSGVTDHDRRLMRVHVDLDRRLIADHQRRLAMPLDFVADLVHRQLLAVDHELGAVTPAGGGRLHGFRPGVLSGGPLEGRDGLSAHPFEEPFEDQLETEPTSVDNPRLFQDRQLFRCPLHGAGRGLTRRAHHLGEVTGFGGLCLGARRRLPGHRQHGALGRLDHRSIGVLRALPDGSRQTLGIDRALRADPDADSPQNLRKDDARVAPGPHQGAVGGPPDHDGEIGIIELADVFDGGLEGEQHVGPRVAVRHGKDIEGIDLVTIEREPGQRTQQCLLEQPAIALRDGHGRGAGYRRRLSRCHH